ncbi:MAG: V-type ATP synthase subunit D [Candidatus Micrarchaeia archaeon]
MQESFNPTRMELLKAKERIKLARKGHKLLKEKRDALVLEFFAILERARDLRSELNAQMKKAFLALAVAQAYHGIFEVENAALSSGAEMKVSVDVKNVMGVKIPIVETPRISRGIMERGYSFLATSAKIDEAAKEFEKALNMVFEVAATENALKRLIREIEKTKRRVNSLEYIVIPSLEKQAKIISFRLDEIEREGFVTLKVIKKKMNR